MTVANQWVEVGVLLRGDFRRELFKAGIRFEEQKGLLVSVFRIPDPIEWRRVQAWVKYINQE